MSTATDKMAPAGAPALDVERIRADFPALHQEVHGKPLVYLDNGATAQKPQTVLDTIAQYYGRDYSNVHRGAHTLSERITAAYEEAREKVRAFINAPESREVVFVRGTTEAINLVAQSYGRVHLRKGDEVLITELEHHANIVPWQMLSDQTGATLKVAPINDAGEVVLEEFERRLGPRTKLVAIAHVSNALGTILPVAKMTEMAHAHGAKVLVDGAQAAPHQAIDVQALGCDFYAFSGHKLFGPTGIGVLYGRAELLAGMPPYQGGGEMIREVTFERTTFADIPQKFEAGTPHIVGAIGLGAAIDYVGAVGLTAIAAYEHELLQYATARLSEVPGLRIIGTAADKAAILSFVLEDVHAHDVGPIVDHEGVAVRTGHHCAMPVMQRYDVAATARASFAMYNTHAEVDTLVHALHRVREMFAR
ncbi:MAG: cysteine desulfurase [Gammaproteobacteria bacterium]